MQNTKTDLNQYTKLYEFEDFDIYKNNNNTTHFLYLFHLGIDESSKAYQKEYTIVNKLKGIYPVIQILKKIYTENRYGFLFTSNKFEVMMQPIRDKNDIKACSQALADMHVNLHNLNIDFEAKDTQEKNKALLNNIVSLDIYKQRLLKLYDGITKLQHFCHYDFGAYHVLMRKNDAMIINWINAGFGNPMSDVAKTVFWLCSDYVPGFGPYLIGSDKKREFVNAYIKRYSELAAFDYDEFLKWLVIFSAIEYDTEIKDEGLSDELVLLENFITDYFTGKNIDYFDYIIWNNLSHEVYQ